MGTMWLLLLVVTVLRAIAKSSTPAVVFRCFSPSVHLTETLLSSLSECYFTVAAKRPN